MKRFKMSDIKFKCNSEKEFNFWMHKISNTYKYVEFYVELIFRAQNLKIKPSTSLLYDWYSNFLNIVCTYYLFKSDVAMLQFLGKLHAVLVMHVVVACTVDE